MVSSSRNTHWRVEADSEDEAVARAKAEAEKEGLEVLRAGSVRMVPETFAPPEWFVTLSTTRKDPS